MKPIREKRLKQKFRAFLLFPRNLRSSKRSDKTLFHFYFVSRCHRRRRYDTRGRKMEINFPGNGAALEHVLCSLINKMLSRSKTFQYFYYAWISSLKLKSSSVQGKEMSVQNNTNENRMEKILAEMKSFCLWDHKSLVANWKFQPPPHIFFSPYDLKLDLAAGCFSLVLILLMVGYVAILKLQCCRSFPANSR